MDTRGRHLLAELYGCDPLLLNDADRIEAILVEAAGAAGTTVVGSQFHPFSPHGVSGVVLVEESHLSIHTWPESGYAAFDIFTCGDCDPESAVGVVVARLRAERHEMMVLGRGRIAGSPSLAVESRS